MNLNDTKLLVAIVPDDGLDSLPIDLVGIAEAEARLAELATANGHNSSELKAFYNRTWLRLDKYVTALTYQKNRAETAKDLAYADALLDVTDEALLNRGHKKTSADLRQALASRDAKYQTAVEVLQKIAVVRDLLQGKAKAFERAFRALEARTYQGQLPDRPLHGGGMPEPMQGPRPNAAQGLQDEEEWNRLTREDAEFGGTRY